MPWVNIPNSVFEAGKPARALDMRNLRDNFAAMQRGEAGAPLGALWHPYDRTVVGGAQTGLLWSLAANGAVTQIDTPLFEIGWDYALYISQIRQSSNATVALNINPFRVVANLYTSPYVAVNLAPNGSGSASVWMELYDPMTPFPFHNFFASTTFDSALNAEGAGATGRVFTHVSRIETINRLRITSGATLYGTGAEVYLYKRRNTRRN